MKTFSPPVSGDPLKRFKQFKDDPLMFLEHCVFTLDEVDKDEPIKRFPIHLDYIRFLVRAWEKKHKLLIPKSRRMTVSWTFIALGLWDCIFHKGRSWAYVSKKEEDSKELVQRAKFIYDHIPEDMISRDFLPKLKRGDMQQSPPALDFEEYYSKIMGFPSGANQMRQRGFSGLLFDEMAFWEEAEGAFASSEPTIKGGGRFVGVSTRYPGFFKKLVYDRLDEKDLNFSETAPVPMKTVMEGVDVWENPRNNFYVIDLSHRANPDKRSPEFEEELRRSLPIYQFRMEYGKSWSAFSEKAVYPDFNENIHCVKTPPKLAIGLPVLLGWDSSGLTPACVIAQLQEDRLVVFREIIGEGMGAERFVPHVRDQIQLHYPQIYNLAEQTQSFFDPAGMKKNEITEETYLQKLISEGFRQVRPGPISFKKRVDGVTHWLLQLSGGKPKFQIYEPDCPVLVAGFKGGYRYPDQVTNAEPDKVRPIKDIHSHPHDGLQYLCSGLTQLQKQYYSFSVPTPSYSFQKGAERGRRDKKQA